MRQLRDPLDCRLISLPEGLVAIINSRICLIGMVLICDASREQNTSVSQKIVLHYLLYLHEFLGVSRELWNVISELSVDEIVDLSLSVSHLLYN